MGGGLGALCLLLCLQAGAVQGQTSLYDYGHGRPSFGMPNSYQDAQSSLKLGKGGKQPGAEASLSSYDQQILANGPPGEGAGGAQLPSGPTPYGSAARPSPAGGGYVYPYPTGGQMPQTQAQLPPAHVASIYTTTYTSAAAAGEAAAERAVAKMQATVLPNPFAPLQQMQQAQAQQQQQGAQGVFASVNSAQPGPPPFTIPPAPPSNLMVKALPFTQNQEGEGLVTASSLDPSEEGQVAVHLTNAANALNPALSDSVVMAKKLAKDAAHAKRARQALAREAARAVKAEQAATLGGMYQTKGGGGPPVLSHGMALIFVVITAGAIAGVIWYVRKPEKREEYTNELLAQSSQQYV